MTQHPQHSLGQNQGDYVPQVASHSRLLRMIDHMPVAVMTVDRFNFEITYANETSRNLIRSIEHLLTIKADDLIGTSIDVFHKDPRHQQRILSDATNLPHNARIKLGPEVLDLKVSAITGNDGSYLGPMLTWAIVTKEVEAERRTHQLAHFDTLTGLANRATFNDELAKHLQQENEGATLLYIDLDGFKIVNDTSGHQAGDGLLRVVANRLREICSAAGTTIGRLGGDEFGVLIPGNDIGYAKRVSERIIAAVCSPYPVDYRQKLALTHLSALQFRLITGGTVRRFWRVRISRCIQQKRREREVTGSFHMIWRREFTKSFACRPN